MRISGTAHREVLASQVHYPPVPMSQAAPIILLVCNPGDRAEIEDMLAGSSIDDVHWSNGSDDTMVRFEQVQPDVVVLSARLDRGDAPSLIAAMRAAAHGAIAKLVLIGDTSGPIRNALDAADLAVDRFLARPLAAKALLYAVRTSAHAARRARAASSPGARAELSRQVESEMNAAIDDFVQNAMSALPSASRSRVSKSTLLSAPPPVTAPPRPDGEAEARPGATPGPDERARAGGGAFARELRHKMSAMAERLFPGQQLKESAPVSHAADDIDLASFGMDTASGVDDDEAGFDRWTRPAPAPASLPAAKDTGNDAALDFGAMAAPGRGASSPGRAPGAEPSTPGMRAQPSRPVPLQRDEASSRGGSDAPSAPAPARAGQADEAEDQGGAAGAAELSGDALPMQGLLRRGEADLAILMERMYRRRFTGRLELQQATATKEILFDKGRPVFASSSLPHDRMGELLVREGKITQEQLHEVHALVARSGRRMGEVLIEMGWLKRRELLPVVRRHIEDIVYSLFAWDSGSYTAVDGDFAAAERIRISRHPAAMILEGVRRKYDGETLEALIGAPESVVEIIDDRKLKTVVSVADLSTAERKVIASFDAERSLAQVHEATSVPLVEIYHLAYGLVVWGAAQSLRRGDEGQSLLAEEPALIGETDLAIDRQRVMAKYALVVEADYFSLLGVRRDATSFEIKRAYEAARRDYAGEGFPPEVRSELGTEITEINEVMEEAYRVLRDDGLRASYLANLRD